MPITPTNPFKGRHFPGEVIVQCVRWYLQYPLAYEHVSQLMAERCAAPIYLRRFRSGVSRTGVSGECWSEPATPDAARNGTGNETRSCNVKSGRLREV